MNAKLPPASRLAARARSAAADIVPTPADNDWSGFWRARTLWRCRIWALHDVARDLIDEHPAEADAIADDAIRRIDALVKSAAVQQPSLFGVPSGEDAREGNAYPSRTPPEDLANPSRRSHEDLTNGSVRAHCTDSVSDRITDQTSDQTSEQVTPATPAESAPPLQNLHPPGVQPTAVQPIAPQATGKQSAKQTGSKPVALCHDGDGSEP